MSALQFIPLPTFPYQINRIQSRRLIDLDNLRYLAGQFLSARRTLPAELTYGTPYESILAREPSRVYAQQLAEILNDAVSNMFKNERYRFGFAQQLLPLIQTALYNMSLLSVDQTPDFESYDDALEILRGTQTFLQQIIETHAVFERVSQSLVSSNAFPFSADNLLTNICRVEGLQTLDENFFSGKIGKLLYLPRMRGTDRIPGVSNPFIIRLFSAEGIDRVFNNLSDLTYSVDRELEFLKESCLSLRDFSRKVLVSDFFAFDAQYVIDDRAPAAGGGSSSNMVVESAARQPRQVYRVIYRYRY